MKTRLISVRIYYSLLSLRVGVIFIALRVTCFCVCTQSLSQIPLNVNPLHLHGNEHVTDSTTLFPSKVCRKCIRGPEMMCVRAGTSIY